jgi:hypothetical protein
MNKHELESLKDFDTWKEWKNTDKINNNMKDSIVNSVLMQFKERSSVGIEKYGTTLDRQDLSTLEWLTHAQEEAMDFVLYLERLKDEYNKPKPKKFTERLMEEMNKKQNEFKTDVYECKYCLADKRIHICDCE